MITYAKDLMFSDSLKKQLPTDWSLLLFAVPPKPLHLQKLSPVTYQTSRHKALSSPKPRMEEDTPTPVSSVTKEKPSKVSDLIHRFEGCRYVMWFLVVSWFCRKKNTDIVVVLKPISARGADDKTACFQMMQLCIWSLQTRSFWRGSSLNFSF